MGCKFCQLQHCIEIRTLSHTVNWEFFPLLLSFLSSVKTLGSLYFIVMIFHVRNVLINDFPYRFNMMDNFSFRMPTHWDICYNMYLVRGKSICLLDTWQLRNWHLLIFICSPFFQEKKNWNRWGWFSIELFLVWQSIQGGPLSNG